MLDGADRAEPTPGRRPKSRPTVRIATVAIHTSGFSLNERSGPSTYNAIRGHLANGATVGVLCQVFGQKLTGPVTTSAWWEVDSHGFYISDAYIAWSPTRPAMPWCGVNTHRAVTATAHVGDDGLSIRSGPSSTTARSERCRTAPCSRSSAAVGARPSPASRAAPPPGASSPTAGYVSDAYVHWSPDQPFMPWCGEAPQTVPPATTNAFIAAAVAPAQAEHGPLRRTRIGHHRPGDPGVRVGRQHPDPDRPRRVRHEVLRRPRTGRRGLPQLRRPTSATRTASATAPRELPGLPVREAESYTDHGLLLSTTPRYRPTLAYTDNPDKFAQALQKAGYATSPKYADNLISVMKRYDLYQYDRSRIGASGLLARGCDRYRVNECSGL